MLAILMLEGGEGGHIFLMDTSDIVFVIEAVIVREKFSSIYVQDCSLANCHQAAMRP